MGKKLTIVIIGLPLFAKRLATQLQSYYPKGKFIALDTYYNRFDKIKALYWIKRADVVFSINGSLQTSTIFDYTLRLKKRLIMNWVGTDVQLAQEAVLKQAYRVDYIEKAIHFCEVEWIQRELKAIGIHAEISNFASFNKRFDAHENFSNRFSVLNYIPEDRKEFYGFTSYIQLAKENPSIDFYIAGCLAAEVNNLPKNIIPLGWVNDMNALYAKIQVCMRIPEHDGLSTFVLEGLARGKQVIYKYDYPNVFSPKSFEELNEYLKSLEKKWQDQTSLINEGGMKFVQEHFNEEFILGNLIETFQKLK